MKVTLDKQPTKFLNRMNEPLRHRLLKALKELSEEPPEGDIKKLSGNDHYRSRVGDYRIIYGIKNNVIVVSKIASRGQAYKEN
jgi:mRNA interferase RelE/StbE